MAQIRYSDLAFSMLLSTQNVQRQPFARPPPYEQRSDGLVIVNDSSNSATAVPPPYVQRSDGLVIVLDSSYMVIATSPPYMVIATSPPYIGWQQPLLNWPMQRPHVPTPFPQYQANLSPHHGSAASRQAHQAYIPSRRRRANIPPRQRRASLHPFNNPPPPQPSDEETQGVMEGGNRPAAEHVIISLPSVVLSSDHEGEDCVICMAELDAQDRITKLPCGHFFHINCVLSWLNIKNTCPICRFELRADEIQVQA